MRTVLLATHNAKKGKELAELAGGRFDVRTVDDVGLGSLIVEEPFDTFEENARAKTDAVLAALPDSARRETWAIIADDSGLCVDILDGKPGVRSARFADDHGVGHGDHANNALLLLLLDAVPDAMRGARFVSVVSALLVDSDRRVEARGTVEGSIAHDLVGGGGFGYDPLFIVHDADAKKRMAELSAPEKHAISHRGRAMRLLIDKLDAAAPFQRAHALTRR